MKKYYLKDLLSKSAVVLLLVATVFIINGCKKSYNDTSVDEIALAKTWYQGVYPVASNAVTGNTKIVNDYKTPIWTDHFNPDWSKGVSYKRDSKTAIELPMSANEHVGIHSNEDNLSHSSFLILKQDDGYQAYIMVLVTDSGYSKNDPGKLEKNSYRHREADFTGRVLYFTPKGDFVNGWYLCKGKVITNLNLTKATGQTNNNRLQISYISEAPATNGCIEYYADYWDDNGNLLFTIDLGLFCSGGSTGGNGGGVIPRDGDGGGGGGTGGDGMPAPNPHNSGGGGDGSSVAPPVDPCAQRFTVSAMAVAMAAKNATIVSSSTTNEYGTDIKLTSVTGSAYVNTTVTTNNSPFTWNDNFTWNSTDGYSLGNSHGHPGGTPPDPDDIFKLVYNLINSPDLKNAGTTAVQFYQSHAVIMIPGSNGNYAVTISDWAGLAALYNNFITNRTAFDNNYLTLANGSGSLEYALMSVFGSSINLYKSAAGSTNFEPLMLDTTNQVSVVKPCP
jgi:hypothetical protein